MNRGALIAIIVLVCLIIVSAICYPCYYGCQNIDAIKKHNIEVIESLGNITGTIYWGIPVTALCIVCIALTIGLGVSVYYNCVPKLKTDNKPTRPAPQGPPAMQPTMTLPLNPYTQYPYN